MGGESASAAVPPSLLAETSATLARAATATAISVGRSAAVLELADGVFRAMAVARLKLAALVVVGIIALGTLPLVLALEPGGRRADARQESAPPVRPVPGRAPREDASSTRQGGRSPVPAWRRALTFAASIASMR